MSKLDGVPNDTLAAALLAAQQEMPAVEPDATNPHFKSKFVSLGHLLSKVRPVLHRNKLSLVQAPAINESGAFVLRTIILHESGESLEFDAPLTPTKNDPQGIGSAITYMRRYSASAALAIADQEDDDGNAGSAPDERTFSQLLRDAGASTAAIKAIVEYASTLNTKQVGAATEGLRGPKAAEFLGRLETAASDFAEKDAA